jgi:CRP-like cAMP-binding protein
MRELRFNPGEVIIEEGSIGTTAYILKTGVVEVYKKAPKKNILLATLEAKEIFGELGLIEDKPRSASVIAKTPVSVDEISREDFLALIDDKASFIIPVMKAFFEHLRQANELVVMLESRGEETATTMASRTPQVVKMEGLTKQASLALSNKVVNLMRFPFKIGRATQHRHDDIFVDNDLYLPDEIPYNVSRNHMSINFYRDQFYVLDRGSSLGTLVNGTQLGGRTNNFRCELKIGENIVILGTESSPYKFRLVVE